MDKDLLANRITARVRAPILLLGGLLLLCLFYLGVVLNVPYTADAGTVMTMAQAVIDGNILLKGWILGTVSFFTTELPFYVAGILSLGFTWKVIYVISALHWALIALLVILLGTGPQDAPNLRARIAIPISLTIYLAELAINSQYLSSGHLVAFAYCLLCLLLIRRMEVNPHWAQYLGYSILLTLSMIGDAFALYLLAIPVAAVCLARLVSRGPRWLSLPLLGTTLASSALSIGILAVLHGLGGATWLGPSAVFVGLRALAGNVLLVGRAALDLFDASWPASSFSPLPWALTVLHLSGPVLLLVVMVAVLKTITRQSLSTQITLAVIVLNVLENLLSTRAGAPRYLAPTLIFGCVLISQVVSQTPLFRDRREWVLLYFSVLGLSLVPRLTYAKPTSQSDALAKDLVVLHLQNGYAPYWRSNSTTVATAGQVTVRPVYSFDGNVAPYPCFSDPDWYNAFANFLVVETADTSGWQPSREQAVRIFGQPAGVYSLGAYGDLLVWNRDITPLLGRGGSDCAFRP